MTDEELARQKARVEASNALIAKANEHHANGELTPQKAAELWREHNGLAGSKADA